MKSGMPKRGKRFLSMTCLPATIHETIEFERGGFEGIDFAVLREA